jgi:ATPase components of ABC transporters with duplicated ATPase domains
MLSINNLNLQYGSKHIFRDVSAQIHIGDRVGLAGVNGAGKSTLLRIMCGEQEVRSGHRQPRFLVHRGLPAPGGEHRTGEPQPL